MDWDSIIEKHRDALARIVVMLLDMAVAGNPSALPMDVRYYIQSILRPAESAARRLIVVTLRRLAIPVPTLVTKKPDFSKVKSGQSSKIPAFRLYDPHKKFDLKPHRTGSKSVPRIHFFGAPTQRPDLSAALRKEIDPTKLFNRIKSLQNALNDLSKQAKRLARREVARIAIGSGPRSVAPIRLGYAPGHRKRHKHEVDEILSECQWLAKYCRKAPS